MREYTVLAFTSVLFTMLLDQLTRAHILRRIEFYVFLLVILGFKLLVNGYLTAKGIVLYSGGQYLGIRLGSIPLEDFFFGFSMVAMTLIFWEFSKAHETIGNRSKIKKMEKGGK